MAVAFGGRGEGPNPGGQVRGPFRVGAVVVLPADERVAQRPFRGIVVQGEVGEVAVADQAVPFPVEGGQHLLRRRVQAVKQDVPPDILQRMRAERKRVEAQHGKGSLGPYSDFEWGMINGKLSALRWVLGDEWDFLDT